MAFNEQQLGQIQQLMDQTATPLKNKIASLEKAVNLRDLTSSTGDDFSERVGGSLDGI